MKTPLLWNEMQQYLCLMIYENVNNLNPSSPRLHIQTLLADLHAFSYSIDGEFIKRSCDHYFTHSHNRLH